MFNSEKILFAANIFASKLVNGLRGFTRQNQEAIHVTSILCVKLDEIGDMASCVHVFAILKKAFPNAIITVYCKPFVKTLIEFDPNIEIVTEKIQLKKYDIWVELRGNWFTLFRSLFRTKKIRLDRGTVRYLQRGNQPHETVTNFNVIKPLSGLFKTNEISFLPPKLYPTDFHKNQVKERLKELEVEGSFVVIHPAARRELRQWPTDRFSTIAAFLWEEFQLQTILVGTIDEASILRAIKNDQSYIKTYVSNDSLLTLYSLITLAKLFVGNESGPLQIADLTGTTVLGLFGPGVKTVFYPRSENARIIHHILDCNPCDQIHCVRPDNPCIRLIEVEEVKTQLKLLLSIK